MNVTNSFLLAAVSGALLGATGCASTPKPADSSSTMSPSAADAHAMQGEKHACKGQNACKGQGGCHTDKNDCTGKNACKGQGGCKTT